MASSPTRSVELNADLLERVQQAAEERGVAVPQLVQEALEHELGAESQEFNGSQQSSDEGNQPPFSLIGAFRSSDGLSAAKVAVEPIARPPA